MHTLWPLASVVIRELYRRKDFYVLFVLIAVITLALGSVNFFNDPKIVRYVREACLTLIWISSLVIAVTLAARQLPAERESRTMFPLLAKPVTRGQVLVGKFLGCWLACGLTLLAFYLFFAVTTGLKGGEWPLAGYGQALWMHWWLLGIVTALTLLGSLVFTSVAATCTIVFVFTGGVLFLGRHLHKVALTMNEPAATLLTALYFVLPHLEFYDLRDRLVHGWPAVPWSALGAATLYGAVYIALLVLAGCRVFRRQPLN